MVIRDYGGKARVAVTNDADPQPLGPDARQPVRTGDD